MTKWIQADTAVRRFHVDNVGALIELIDCGKLDARNVPTKGGYYLEVDAEAVAKLFPRKSTGGKVKEQSLGAILGAFAATVVAEITDVAKSLSEIGDDITDDPKDIGTSAKTAVVQGLGEFRVAAGLTRSQLAQALDMNDRILRQVEDKKPIRHPIAQHIVSRCKSHARSSAKALPIPKIEANES